jgi:hypothetical protein
VAIYPEHEQMASAVVEPNICDATRCMAVTVGSGREKVETNPPQGVRDEVADLFAKPDGPAGVTK